MERHQWDPVCERPSGLVRPCRIDPTGAHGPTRGQAYGPGWRQVSSGSFVPSGVDDTVLEQRILEQSGRMRGRGRVDGGAVTGWAALRWRGARFFDGTAPGVPELPVPLVVGLARLREDPRVALSQEQIAPTERELVDGLWCTTVQRALFDEVRRTRSLREGAVAVDMAAAAALISVRLFTAYVGKRGTWTGVPFAREVVRFASDHSRSPQETRMRLCWQIEAALPPPVCNQPLYDHDGRLLGVPDLFDPVAGLVGEYDGADHREHDRRRGDLNREDRFRDHGLEYFTVVEGDLTNRWRVAGRMLRARSRAKFLPPESCAWTSTPPPWVRPAETLDARLERLGLAERLTLT